MGNTGLQTESAVLDYFEVDGRPVVVNRQEDSGWVWTLGNWKPTPGIVEKSYGEGELLTQDVFVSRFPYAALGLLEEASASPEA